MFTYTFPLRFREADPAGIMFFGNLLFLAHDTFEAFLLSRGLSWSDWFQQKNFMAPVRHAECDYHHPLRPGNLYTARLEVIKMGETSLHVMIRFWEENLQILVAEARLVYVFTDPTEFKKKVIPDEIRRLLGPPSFPGSFKE